MLWQLLLSIPFSRALAVTQSSTRNRIRNGSQCMSFILLQDKNLVDFCEPAYPNETRLQPCSNLTRFVPGQVPRCWGSYSSQTAAAQVRQQNRKDQRIHIAQKTDTLRQLSALTVQGNIALAPEPLDLSITELIPCKYHILQAYTEAQAFFSFVGRMLGVGLIYASGKKRQGLITLR